jgi:hypothetical protein
LESWNIKGPEIVETFLRNDSATMNPQPPETTGDGANMGKLGWRWMEAAWILQDVMKYGWMPWQTSVSYIS